MRNLLIASLVLSAGCHTTVVNQQPPPPTHSCTNFIQDGDETDVDCGGATCPRCGDGRLCAANGDCASSMCSATSHCQEGAFTVPTDIYAIAGGGELFIMPGQQAGFGITAAMGGSSFRLVWTGDGNVSGTYHEFYGSVYTDGTFTSITPGCSGQCSFDRSSYVAQPYSVPGGERVDFDANNVNDIDGFDFVVDGGASGTGEPVYFDLFIDGNYVPMAIFFADATTGQAAYPQTIPFGLTTQ
jgi:hypothetical protein